MNDSRSTSLRHRVHFRRAAAGLALGLITTLTGCSGGGTAPNGTLVMIIRHGEKPGEKKTGDMPGLDASGHKNHNALTQTGWDRAQALVNVFAPDSGKPRAGLARPKAIYAAGADSTFQSRSRHDEMCAHSRSTQGWKRPAIHPIE